MKLKRFHWAKFLGFLPAILMAQSAQAVSLNLLPAVQTVSVGDTVTLDVQISDLGNFQAPSLSGFDLDVGFDPSVLMFNNIAFGDPTLGDLVNLSNTPGLTSVIPSSGLVNFAEISLDSDTALNAAQPSSFILARLNFKALAAAPNSPLNLLVNALSDENTNSLTGTANGASVTVQESAAKIPEPNISFLGLVLTVGLGVVLTQKKA